MRVHHLRSDHHLGVGGAPRLHTRRTVNQWGKQWGLNRAPSLLGE